MSKGPILITGAAKRLGKALALDLGAMGYPVGVHFGTSENDAEKVVREITNKGGKAAAIKANLLDNGEVDGLLGRAAEALGAPIEILINNAGAFEKDDLKNLKEESFNTNIGTNLRTPLVLSHHFAKQLPKNTPGNIINIIDQRVLTVTEGFLTYTVSKHALYDLTRLLALELAPDIRVNAIGPGPTLQSRHQSPEDFKSERKNVPLGLGPKLGEFSKTVAFILNTPSLTGQMIALDGGQHLL